MCARTCCVPNEGRVGQPTSACLCSPRAVGFSDVSLTTHPVVPHMSCFPPKPFCHFAPRRKRLRPLAHIVDIYACTFLLVNVSHLRLSKEKFQNATCTLRETPLGLRQQHVPKDPCPRAGVLLCDRPLAVGSEDGPLCPCPQKEENSRSLCNRRRRGGCRLLAERCPH